MSHLNTRNSYENVLAAAQDLTAAWADCGSEINVTGYTHIGLWVNLDINDSLNARIRVLAKHTAAHADEFVLPIKSVGASSISIEDNYYEFNVDADQKVLLEVELGNHAKFIQIQVEAGTAGASAGQIDSLVLSKTWRA